MRGCRVFILALAMGMGWVFPVANAERISVIVYSGADQPTSSEVLQTQMTAMLHKKNVEVMDAFSEAETAVRSHQYPLHGKTLLVRSKRLASEAWHSYLEGRTRFASARLQEALLLAVPLAHLEGGVALLADICLRLGVTRLELGQKVDASDDFRLSHRLAPTKAVVDDEFKPEVVEFFAHAIASGELGQRHTVVLSPPEALFWVDGNPQRTRQVKISTGFHLLSASAPGYVTRTEIVSVPEGDQSPIMMELEEEPSAMLVLRGREELVLGTGEERARQIAQSVLTFAQADALIFMSSVWRRGQRVLLGQICDGKEIRCSSVIEIVYRDSELTSALASLYRRMRESERMLPPRLQVDIRVLSGGLRPTSKASVSVSLWRNPWIWAGGAAVVLTGGAIYFSRGTDSISLVVVGERCGFGGC